MARWVNFQAETEWCVRFIAEITTKLLKSQKTASRPSWIISRLGPLLFLIYVNDLEKNIKSNIKFFADATMLFSIVKHPVISAKDLNDDLNVIHEWAYQ